MSDDHVVVEVEDYRWCLRHYGMIAIGQETCDQWENPYAEDPGRCTPVPLYIDAPDP